MVFLHNYITHTTLYDIKTDTTSQTSITSPISSRFVRSLQTFPISGANLNCYAI